MTEPGHARLRPEWEFDFDSREAFFYNLLSFSATDDGKSKSSESERKISDI